MPVDEPIAAEDIRLLLNLAFVAAGRAAVADVDVLAGGLLAARPRLTGPVLAQALARMNAGRAAEAVTLLDQHPPSAEADPDGSDRTQHQAVLGWALQLVGRAADSHRVLEAAAAHPAGGLARALLGAPPDAGRGTSAP